MAGKDLESVREVGSEYYPGLFRGANTASTSAQRTWFLLQKIYLGSLVASGIASETAFLLTGHLRTWALMAIAISLALGLLFVLVIRTREDDVAWFDCRAVAESAKTITWRFMMRTPPFDVEESADQRYIAALQEIREARPSCHKRLAAVLETSACAIADVMRRVRSLPFPDRRCFYIEQRLLDQKAWYSGQARRNARAGESWFWTTTALQGCAVTLSIVQAAVGDIGFNVVPVLTTVAAAVVAWGQMKRHDELARTYSVAAQELGELEAIAKGITGEDGFPRLVEQVEETISREHTMWCSRGDIVLRRTMSIAQ